VTVEEEIMGSPVKLYQREMHDNLGFFPTWLPGDGIQIGDAGVLEGGRFRRAASIAELGIPCEVSAGAARQDIQYTSTQGISVGTSAGAAAAPAKGEIRIEFSREGAFLFHASRLQARQLENRAKVGDEIVKAYRRGKWDKSWLLVEALHTAERATVIVSEDSSAELVLAASADVPLVSLSLADPKIALTVTSARGRIVHIIGGKGLHPLYSCLRLKDPLFGAPSVQPVRGAGNNESPFVRPAIDELLES
jgi:hypothetical protein